MSSTIYKLIPEDVHFMPEKANVEQVRSYLASIFPVDKISIEQLEDIQFVDQGENFVQITCPSCDTVIELKWWHQAMDNAWQSAFKDLDVQLPCCSAHSTLHGLHYDFPAGFSRLIFEIENPEEEVTAEQVRMVEQLLGCEIRMVNARY
ncbi:hypothetical protein C8Z91_03150 [Paenibacillus elgii]|uniref:Uncharacterized protein n=1 Tax=Paenibacillus elgii TaxID=189691 RepID=A0A2T6G8I6_9BACL|nr:hypothetical protein [Paenibacillus elgii]PUA40471.1 hypothetical protein C8Z91_03150 [Paenibacillus elgii]